MMSPRSLVLRGCAYCALTMPQAFGLVKPLLAQTNALPSTAVSGQTEKTFVRQDAVPFTKGVHGDLLADLYMPAGKEPHPAIVYLHGGAWKHGERIQLEPAASYLAEHGFFGMAIDYDQTALGDRFPLPLQEAERGVAWLRQNAARYNVDPERIGVAGSSAGGELAALLALDRNPLPGAQVEAAVIFNGVLDLSETGPDAEDMVAPYLGGSCTEKPKECEQASPLRQVHAGAPPFYVGHGTADRVVPYTQAVTFVRELRDAHVPVTPFVAEGAGHTYWGNDLWRTPNLEAVVKFLRLYLSGPPAPLPAAKP